MRRIRVVEIWCLLMLCLSSAARATDSAVQFSAKGSEAFGRYGMGENAEGAFSMFANLNWTVNSGTVLAFGYVGPEWTFEKSIRLRLYSGVMATSGGTTSVIASTWLDFMRLGMDGLGLFLQFDANFPQHNKKPEGSERTSFYGQLVINMRVDEQVTFSLFNEFVADTEDVYELAFGPLVRGKVVGLWVGFDLTPNVPDSWRLLTRINIYVWK